jgi:hypothetical protein
VHTSTTARCAIERRGKGRKLCSSAYQRRRWGLEHKFG